MDHLLIYPGHSNNALYLPGTHGKNTPTAFLTPEAAFYNAALFPAWQKWKPTYRVADITSIYGDLCSVAIYDPRTDEQQGDIDVDYDITYINVPFNVKSYAADRFAEGDRVIIRFVDQNYESPEVFGYYENPCTSTSTTTTTSSTSSISSTSFSTTSYTSSTTSYTTGTSPPSHWYTIQGESAPFQSDGALYHFTDMEFDAEDLDHTDPPSAYGVAVYTGLTYVPTGYVSVARNILIKYDGDSNQTILTSGSYGTQYQDIAYDITNNRLVGITYTGSNNVYFFQGITLTVDTFVTIPDPPDLKLGTSAKLGGIAIDSGTLLLSQWYTRNDDAAVYRILRTDYAGSILNNYQTIAISGDNISNLCMSHGNTGTLIALKVNKSVDVFDSGPGSAPINYSISHLPCNLPPSGIATNVLST